MSATTAAPSPDREASTKATIWRPLATVAVFSVLPLAGFLYENRLEVVVDLTFISYVLVLLVPGVLIVGLAARVGGRVSAEKAAVLFAIAAYLLFKFGPVEDAADAIGIGAGWGSVLAWAAVLALALFAGLRLARYPLGWTYVLVVGALLTALPLGQYLNYKVSGEGSASAGQGESAPVPSEPIGPARSADVYYFLLDSYGRNDVFRSLYGFDTSPFLEGLREDEFRVATGGTSPYNATHLSMPSIFEMDYRVTSGLVGEYGPYYESISGENPVVDYFRESGYDFALATDSPQSEGFKCTDRADICMRPEETLGEREWALLATTPFDVVLPKLGVSQEGLSDKDSVLTPEAALSEIESRRDEDPLFAYVHLIQPHPPFLYTQDCGIREFTAASSWGEELDGKDIYGTPRGEGGEGYRSSVQCLNRSLERAIDTIVSRNPEAVIVIQGDHGPAVPSNQLTGLQQWTKEDIDARYSVLSAARLPGCPRGPAIENTVNTFRVVLGCLGGEPLPLLPSRRYAVEYVPEHRVVPVPDPLPAEILEREPMLNAPTG